MAAGVAVTAWSACGIPVPVHCRKLLTQSRRVIELVGFETNVRKRKHNGLISNWGLLLFDDCLPASNSVRVLQQQLGSHLDNVTRGVAVGPRIGAVGQSHHVHGVGDEDESVGMCVEGNLDCGWVQVEAVGDDAKVRPRKALGDAQDSKDARVAVVQRAHRVEQVSDHGCAQPDGFGRLFVRGLGMSHRVDDASLGEFRDQLHHLAALRRRRDVLDGDLVALGPRMEILLSIAGLEVLKRLRLYQDVDVVHAVLGRAQKRALAVRAERLGPIFGLL